MLVLSRKLGESVEIGDNKVIVRVLGIKRSKVQLGVDAPPEVAIHRSEKADQYSGQESKHSRLPRPTSTRGRERTWLPDESILEDLARIQAEIMALMELVGVEEQLVARQVASEAVERLTAIKRTVRSVRRQSSEQPIGSFMDSRSRALQQMHCDDTNEVDSQSEVEARTWTGPREDPATMIRESRSAFDVVTSPCALS